jgi:pantoate kinase
VEIRSAVGGRLPISRDVATRLIGERPVRVVVELEHQLPIGQGFGMSAAGALATALSVGRVLGEPRGRSVTLAHLADLFGGGGLGGVSAILGGGLEVRRTPGVPPFGRVEHRSFLRPIVLAVTGPPLPSPPLLRDRRFRTRVDRAAAVGLKALLGNTTTDRFLTEAERFADRLGLADVRLKRIVRSLRAEDIRVSQAMFGRSLFAVAESPAAHERLLRKLARLGLPAVVVSASKRGATVATRSSKHL